MRSLLFFFCFLSLAIINGCKSWSSSAPRLGKKDLIIQTLSLYNQHLTPDKESSQTWKGDWLLRHKRLTLIDQNLSNEHPDLIFFQEVLEKKDNIYQSDINILKAGTLNSYDIKKSSVITFESTAEIESGVLAYKQDEDLLSAFDPAITWKMGEDGYIILNKTTFENKPLYLFNVKMPQTTNHQKWFQFMENKIQGTLLSPNHKCKNRIIIAGFFVGEPDSIHYQNFLRNLSLKDSARGFCEMKTSCATQVLDHNLAQIALTNSSNRRSDRILVHQSTSVMNSEVNFNNKVPAQEKLKKKYGLNFIYPSLRFGWKTNIVLAKCL